MFTLTRYAKAGLSQLTGIHSRNHWLRKPHGYSVASFRIVSSSRPLIAYSLPFAEQVRRALIRNRVVTSHSEAITGKTVAGMPLEGHEHAHYFATDEDGDGWLEHVTFYCPRGFDEADVEALRSLRTIYRHANRPEVRMILIGLSGVEMFSQRKTRPEVESRQECLRSWKRSQRRSERLRYFKALAFSDPVLVATVCKSWRRKTSPTARSAGSATGARTQKPRTA